MKKLILFILINNIKSQTDFKWDDNEENDVVILNSDNFENFIKKYPRVFVKFCSENCVHCQYVKNNFSQLAKKMKEQINGIPIAQIQLNKNEELFKKYEIKGFPSFQLFIDEENIEYLGDKDTDSFIKWIEQNRSFELNEIQQKQDLENLKQQELAVLFLLPESKYSILNKYVVFSLNYPKIPFAHSFSKELKQEFKASKNFTFIVFRKFQNDYKKLELDQLENLKKFKKFFNKVQFPIVVNFSSIVAELIFVQRQDALIYLSDTEDEKFELFKEYANSKKEHKLILTHSSLNHDLGIKLSNYLDIEFDQQSQFRIIGYQDKKFKKFKVDGSSLQSIENSVQDYFNEKLKPYYKSLPLPNKNEKSLVKIVVSDNFDDILCNNDQYVFLFSFAPWCDHSINFSPIFEKLAKNFQNQNIIFAKIDASYNEHPALIRNKFPSLQLFIPGKLDSIKYKGERNFKDIKKFLLQETNRQKFENDEL